MKKKLFFVFLGFFIFSAFLNAQSLDEAIIGAAVKISRDLPANTKVAIINFRSDSVNLNNYIINELYGAILRNRRITPIISDQAQLQSIQGDLPSNASDTISKESAQRIMRLLNVQYLITGSMERVGSEYKISFNAIDTNAEIKSQYSTSINPQNDSQFASVLSDKPQPSASVSVPAASTSASKQKPVTIAAIAGVTVPVTERTPVTAIKENAQYKGTVTWSPAVSGTFASDTQYTATITLTAKSGYTFDGVLTDFFKVPGAIATNSENSGIVTAVFPPVKDLKNAKFNTLGVSLGVGYPLGPAYFITTVHGTLAPFKYSFFKLGMDIGWEHIGYYKDDSTELDECFYLYPFIDYALFVPFTPTDRGKRSGGWYIGLGLGEMIANYTFDDVGSVWDASTTMNFFTGVNIFGFDIFCRFCTDYNGYYDLQLSVGYVYRFK
ncbi:hypothetical protein R84B8_02784 [Treponema sp. R8-4-B8]